MFLTKSSDFGTTSFAPKTERIAATSVFMSPAQTVSLNSVPEVSLHIEVYRISGGVVDFCHKRIAALKISLVFDVAEHKNGADRAYLGKYIGSEQLYISKTESAFVCFV